MPGADEVLIAARSALLDAPMALGDHAEEVTLIGAQAIYLHTGAADCVLAQRAVPGRGTRAEPHRVPGIYDQLYGVRLGAPHDRVDPLGLVPGDTHPALLLVRDSTSERTIARRIEEPGERERITDPGHGDLWVRALRAGAKIAVPTITRGVITSAPRLDRQRRAQES